LNLIVRLSASTAVSGAVSKLRVGHQVTGRIIAPQRKPAPSTRSFLAHLAVEMDAQRRGFCSSQVSTSPAFWSGGKTG
jgi:hypothetical protein